MALHSVFSDATWAIMVIAEPIYYRGLVVIIEVVVVVFFPKRGSYLFAQLKPFLFVEKCLDDKRLVFYGGTGYNETGEFWPMFSSSVLKISRFPPKTLPANWGSLSDALG